MTVYLFQPQAVIDAPLTVQVVGSNLEIVGAKTATPTMTPNAARLTAERMIAVADRLEGHTSLRGPRLQGH